MGTHIVIPHELCNLVKKVHCERWVLDG